MLGGQVHVNFWRPITAIQNGDADDNVRTEADPAWTPLFPTPQHPEYLSGHSTNSSAMATVLTLLFGDETGCADRHHQSDESRLRAPLDQAE